MDYLPSPLCQAPPTTPPNFSLPQHIASRPFPTHVWPNGLMIEIHSLIIYVNYVLAHIPLSSLNEAGRLVDEVTPLPLAASIDRRRQSDRCDASLMVNTASRPATMTPSATNSPSPDPDNRKWSLPAAARPGAVARRLSRLALFGGGGGTSTSSSSGYSGSRKSSKSSGRSGEHLDAQECFVQ